jgi:hypothetical protein
MNADHTTICKFESADGDDYEQVSGNIVILAESATKAFAERQRLARLAAPGTTPVPEPAHPACM